MALLTEEDVRRMSNHGTRGPVVVNRDQVLTPGAKEPKPGRDITLAAENRITTSSLKSIAILNEGRVSL